MDIPIIAMVMRSGWVAKGILILLGVLSVITWAVIFNRYFYLKRLINLNKRFRTFFDSIDSIAHIARNEKKGDISPFSRMGNTLHSEYNRLLEDAQRLTGLKDWSFFLQSQFSMAQEKISAVSTALHQQLDHGVIVLAIISSAAPFMGLLGTVWGIMNSFFEIGNQGSASLPVVAPGIAEALITTLVGLAVAIPAVIFYNWFVHKIERIEDDIDEFGEQILIRLKREVFTLLYSENKHR